MEARQSALFGATTAEKEATAAEERATEAVVPRWVEAQKGSTQAALGRLAGVGTVVEVMEVMEVMETAEATVVEVEASVAHPLE